MSVLFTPLDPAVADAFRLEVHDAIWQCLVEEAGAPAPGGWLGPEESARLATWANSCEHPDGQRAALAWAIACLAKLGPCSVTIASEPHLSPEPLHDREKQPKASRWRKRRAGRDEAEEQEEALAVTDQVIHESNLS
jgi:hypothetical protein